MVLTCRAVEYEEIIGQVGAVLARAAVVELEPVTNREAAEYLPAGQADAGRGRWEPITRHLLRQPGGTLAGVFSTPLMVHLARVVYRDPGTSPADLLRFTDTAALEDHLLRSYVPALYPEGGDGRPPGRRHYPPEKAHRWLAFLAGHLTRTRSRDFTWWQLVDAVPSSPTRQAAGGVLLVAVISHVVVFGGAAERGPVTVSLIVAMLLGPIIGAVMGLADGQPARVRLRPRSFLTGLAIGGTFPLLAFPLVLAVCLLNEPALTSVLDAMLLQALLCLVGAPLVGTVAFLLEGIGTAVGADRPAGSRALLRDDRRAFLVTTTAAVLVIGLITYGLARVGGLGADGGPLDAGVLLICGRAALTMGLVIGLTSGTGGAWRRFTYARVWLVVHGVAPWRILDFLDDAHDRGVLRRIGPAYQFRHARLQTALALRDAADATVRAPAGAADRPAGTPVAP